MHYVTNRRGGRANRIEARQGERRNLFRLGSHIVPGPILVEHKKAQTRSHRGLRLITFKLSNLTGVMQLMENSPSIYSKII